LSAWCVLNRNQIPERTSFYSLRVTERKFVVFLFFRFPGFMPDAGAGKCVGAILPGPVEEQSPEKQDEDPVKDFLFRRSALAGLSLTDCIFK
jgi:hypothetical protein